MILNKCGDSMKLKILIFLFVFALVLLTGCATRGDVEKLQTEIDSLKSDISTLTYQIKNTNSKINELTSKSKQNKVSEGDATYIREGLTKDQVKEIMGTPDKVWSLGKGGSYSYGRSRVSFHNVTGLVDGWDNTDGNLKLEE